MNKTVVTVLLILILLSCEDKSPRSSVPYAPVNFTLQLNSYDNILNNPLTYKVYLEKDRRLPTDRFGFSGLLVVTDATGDAIYAYDLCCPVESRKNVTVIPQNNGKAECPECGSVFITIYGSFIPGMGMVGLGSPESGPAATNNLPLKSYNIMPLQNGEFRIFN